MRRSAITAVSLGIVALGLPASAWAQTTTGTGSTTSGTTTGGTSTTPASTVAPVTGPPSLSKLRLVKTVVAEQGHARFMLGVTAKTQGTVTVTITDAKKKVVRTVTSTQDHIQGAVWFLIQAVNDQGYQLPAGKYSVQVVEKNSSGTSKPMNGKFLLSLTPPRGRLDAYTVPNLPAIARQLKIAPGGQLVTALGAKGALVNAGLRRNDVITKINGLDVTTPGQWQAAIKALPADAPFPIEYLRAGTPVTASVQLPPDWTLAPDYAPTFKVLLARSAKKPVLGNLVADVRSKIDAGKLPDAQTDLDAWPSGLKATAVGQMVQGEILLAKDDLKGALKAYEAATAKDPTLAPALLGKGLVLSRLDRTADAVPVFQAAVAQDPGDAVGQAFLAYALVATNQNDAAIQAAQTAITLDGKYEDGPVALGLAQIAAGDKRAGASNLKKGLLLMSDQKRADQLIAENLEPNS